MKIETLKELRDSLKDVPEDLLDSLWFGTGEGTNGIVQVVANEGSDKYEFPQVFELINDKYPNLNDAMKFINNIVKVNVLMNESDENLDKYDELYCDRGVTSEDKLEETKKEKRWNSKD